MKIFGIHIKLVALHVLIVSLSSCFLGEDATSSGKDPFVRKHITYVKYSDLTNQQIACLGSGVIQYLVTGINIGGNAVGNLFQCEGVDKAQNTKISNVVWKGGKQYVSILDNSKKSSHVTDFLIAGISDASSVVGVVGNPNDEDDAYAYLSYTDLAALDKPEIIENAVAYNSIISNNGLYIIYEDLDKNVLLRMMDKSKKYNSIPVNINGAGVVGDINSISDNGVFPVISRDGIYICKVNGLHANCELVKFADEVLVTSSISGNGQYIYGVTENGHIVTINPSNYKDINMLDLNTAYHIDDSYPMQAFNNGSFLFTTVDNDNEQKILQYLYILGSNTKSGRIVSAIDIITAMQIPGIKPASFMFWKVSSDGKSLALANIDAYVNSVLDSGESTVLSVIISQYEKPLWLNV